MQWCVLYWQSSYIALIPSPKTTLTIENNCPSMIGTLHALYAIKAYKNVFLLLKRPKKVKSTFFSIFLNQHKWLRI